MRCAYLIPTANPVLASECFAAWRKMGWDTFAIVEGNAHIEHATRIIRRETYAGWSESFNILAREVGWAYDWLATGGDDCFPDLTHDATTIGAQLAEHFGGTFGVCQAAGDGWAYDKDGTVDPICFAPIIGKEFCERWNGGKGAFWPGYHSWFADNELHDTTKKAGRLWVRRDLHIEHRHPAKLNKPSPPYKLEKHPLWPADHDLYHSRKAAGFPGHKPNLSGKEMNDLLVGFVMKHAGLK